MKDKNINLHFILRVTLEHDNESQISSIVSAYSLQI